MQISVAEMYGDWAISDEQLERLLTRSLNPRPSTLLYDKLGELGLTADHLLLDIGCRDAKHTCVLVNRFGCRAIGIDPVEHHLHLCAATIITHQLTERVMVRKGAIEALPIEDDSVDFIWCRDVLTHVPNLQVGFKECGRVLKPGGKMLVYQTFATDRLEAGEAAKLYPPLAVVAQNMLFLTVQWALKDTGLVLAEKDVIGSEWREWWEENGVATTSKQLLQIARMQRDRERLIEEIGALAYENELANCYWGVYQMLGKLEPMVYVLQRVG